MPQLGAGGSLYMLCALLPWSWKERTPRSCNREAAQISKLEERMRESQMVSLIGEGSEKETLLWQVKLFQEALVIQHNQGLPLLMWCVLFLGSLLCSMDLLVYPWANTILPCDCSFLIKLNNLQDKLLIPLSLV